MKCPFSMGTGAYPVRTCERHECGIWDGTEKKGKCGLLSLLKKLTYIGDMLSAIDDKLEVMVKVATPSTDEGEKEDV